jgi:hypothetical protein
MSGTRRLPRGRIAKRGPIRTRSSPSDSAEGGRNENRRPERVRGKGDFGGAPKVGENRFFAPGKNSARSRAGGSRRRTPGVGGRHGAKRLPGTARRGRSARERRSENRGKTGKNGIFRRRFEETSGYTGRNHIRRTRPEATDAWAQSGPVGRRVGFEKRREKVENSTIRGQLSEPSTDRSPSTQSDETRQSDATTRRPPGRKISSRSEERFGRRGRRRGTTRRARRQKDQSTRAARRRTRRRRGTDARNSRQYGARRVGETEQKKIAKIGEGVRKLSTIRRTSKSGFVRRRPSARR